MSLSEFFNTYLNPVKIIESKREWKAQTARENALPEDYKYVFDKIMGHLWMFTGGDGADVLKLHSSLLDLFEEGAANGRHILEITGEDVAAFCEELLKSVKTWTGDWKTKLNRDIRKKIYKENDES